ncbi:ATP-binding protein [Nocardiopsis mangrovi]|uniref:ATP-binding protein n=1 Tax=Nocardiopsis mangrovi TaxID=1179818 RepID=A0ABV9DSD4_9ACTN
MDWLRFGGLCSRAKAAERSGDADTALARLDDALGLWRGEPLTGLSGTWAESARVHMRRAHRTALASWGRLATRLRDPDDLIGPLNDHLADYPDDQLLARHLISTLHATGRTTEAMDVYQTIKRRLREDHGTDPGADLQRAHQTLLGSASRPRGSPPSPGQRAPRPQRDNLSRDIPDFTGRHTELAALLSSARSPSPNATTVHVINGMAGVGKTALATHAAHRLKDVYPDARLHLELRGADKNRPKDPFEALHELLVMLDVAAESIPSSLEQRAALWRDRTAGTRSLVILDDAAGHEQVRPLIPGASGCTVVITSRQRLHELDGARHTRLAVPERDDAVAMFAKLAERERARADEHLARLVDLCDRLPLALRLMANRWRQHPAWSLGEIVGQLEQARDRIAVIGHGSSRNLQAVFEVSLRGLSAPAHAAFVRLGLHPTPEFHLDAAAAVIGEPPGRGALVLEELADHSLIEEPQAHRYTMHALLAAFAHSRAEQELPVTEHRAVLGRMLDHYLSACGEADRMRFPHRHRLRPEIPSPGKGRLFDSAEAAAQWFATERRVLLSVATQARRDFEHHAAALAHALGGFFDAYGPWDGADIDLHRWAVESRSQEENPSGLAHALSDLCAAQIRAGRWEEAQRTIERVLPLFIDVHDTIGTAQSLVHLGRIQHRLGSYSAARAHHRDALALYRAEGHTAGMATCLAEVATCDLSLSKYRAAIDGFNEALALAPTVDDTSRRAQWKNNLAGAYKGLGFYREAERLLFESVTLHRELGNRSAESVCRANVGELRAYRWDYEGAVTHYLAALRIQRETRDRWNEATTLCNLGRAYLELNAPGLAMERLSSSLTIAADLGDAKRKPEILIGIGDVHARIDRDDEAFASYREAVHIADRHGLAQEKSEALARCGYLNIKRNNIRAAREEFEQAVQIARDLEIPEAHQFAAALEATFTPDGV